MKRLFIVVEGQTEADFVSSVLAPYFLSYGIYDVNPIKIHTSKTGKGGFVNYIHLKNTVTPLLKSQGEDVDVTTFVDYFRMPNNTPQYDKCMLADNAKDRVAELERCISEDFNDRRFLPYIQMHEFEALLFSDNKGLKEYFSEEEATLTGEIVDAYENPEDINTHPQNAPSKRILSIKKSYNKPLEGNLIALEIGISTILNRCTRFATWVNRIIQMCQ